MNADRIRIAYVITDLEVGGVPLHLLRLAAAMRRRGHEPSVISLKPPGPVGDRLQSEGVPVFSCDGRGGWDLRVVGRLADHLDRLQPALAHAVLFHANLALRWAAVDAGLPRGRILCEIQTVEVERRWHLAVDRWTVGGCRCVIGNSPSVIEHLATQARIPRDRLLLIRGGIDPGPIRDAKPASREALGVEGPMVLWVGRLDPVKGLSHLLEAFGAITRRTGAHLVLAGAGPELAPLVEKVKRMALSRRVRFLGARHDVPALLKAADVFAFPSRTEGLPNALLEAMAAACPIVATDVPGCRDLIRHEQTGLLVPYGDIQALGGSMERLLGDRVTATMLAQNAAAEVDARWHIEGMLNAYEALYGRVVSDRYEVRPYQTKPEPDAGKSLRR